MRTEKWVRPALQTAAVLLAFVLIAGCAGVKARKQSFSSYIFSAADNPSLSKDAVGSVDWMAKIITVVVPPGTRVSSMIATYVAPEGSSVYVRSQGSTIAQVNGATENDFRRPVQYLLVLEDATEVEFVVKLREAETNPNLASLTLGDNVVFTPGFSTNVEGYAAEVPYAIGELKIRPNAESPYARITIDGRKYPARNATATAALRAGEVNAISIVVTAKDEVTARTYTINVRRAEPDRDASLASLTVTEGITLTPKFSTDMRSYQVRIPYAQNTMTFTALPSSAVATVTVQGKPFAPGKESAPVVLGDELKQAIEIVVTAQDGTTRTIYIVNVQIAEPDRDASLASITLNEGATLTPKLSSGTSRYAVAIPNTMDTVVLTPTTSSLVATLKVAGKAVPSGSAAAPLVLAEDSTTNLEIVVTAQDNKTVTTYYLEVTRKPLDPSWAQAAANAGFTGRYGFETAVFKGKLWLIGGHGTEAAETSVWSSKDGQNWTAQTSEAPMTARDSHKMIVFKDELYIIVGQKGSTRFADVWSSKDGLTWAKVADLQEAGFKPRILHAASVYAGRLWVSGGYADGFGALNDVWYSKDGREWKQATESATFPARLGHQMETFKGKLWLIGCTDNKMSRSDVWYFNAKE